MSVGKASIRRAANAGSGGTVKKSVLTPLDSEDIQVKFLLDRPGGEKAGEGGRPVRLTEEMPDYLL